MSRARVSGSSENISFKTSSIRRETSYSFGNLFDGKSGHWEQKPARGLCPFVRPFRMSCLGWLLTLVRCAAKVQMEPKVPDAAACTNVRSSVYGQNDIFWRISSVMGFLTGSKDEGAIATPHTSKHFIRLLKQEHGFSFLKSVAELRRFEKRHEQSSRGNALPVGRCISCFLTRTK